MNRTDAAAILSIDPSASPDEAKRAYQELFTEHQVRLTNAPTPALRSLYQARLLELDEARDAFLANAINDADSDLPTDQPSIPTYRTPDSGQQQSPPSRTSAPPPPPPRHSDKTETAPRKQPPPPPPPKADAPVVEEKKAPAKKSGVGKAIGVLVGLVLVVIALTQIPRFLSSRTDDATKADSSSSGPTSSYADSIPKLRESITVARVEFGRGDYDAANGALKDADAFFSRVGSDAESDTALAHIKSQVDSLHGKVSKACDALKKVAERHPGEPTCKSL